jgi:hypothetical protein
MDQVCQPRRAEAMRFETAVIHSAETKAARKAFMHETYAGNPRIVSEDRAEFVKDSSRFLLDCSKKQWYE